MSAELKRITDNYKNDYEIANELDTVTDLEQFLEYDNEGNYKFVYFYKCNGPKLRHKKEKCGQTEPYNEGLVKLMVDKIRGIYRFRKAVKDCKIQELERESLKQKREQEEVRLRELKLMMDEMIRMNVKKEGTMIQMIKGKKPPIWSGQKYERFKDEVERWAQNNKATEEKFSELIESLKQNNIAKDYVTQTVLEKMTTIRTVKRFLEVMSEKYEIPKSDRILELMRKNREET